MQKPVEITMTFSEMLISKVEFYPEREELFLHTNNREGCVWLWNNLYGQIISTTEGRIPIEYDIPADVPTSLVVDVEGDVDQLILLLNYLEKEMDRFLPAGTAQAIEKRMNAAGKLSTDGTFFASSRLPAKKEESSESMVENSADEQNNLDSEEKHSPK